MLVLTVLGVVLYFGGRSLSKKPIGELAV
jgi:hypothetical protein